MNTELVITVALSLIFGLAVALVNTLITRANIGASSAAGLMGVNMLRMLLDIAALAATYFVCGGLGLATSAALIAVAVGLSVGTVAFLKIMLNNKNKAQPQNQNDNTADGGE